MTTGRINQVARPRGLVAYSYQTMLGQKWLTTMATKTTVIFSKRTIVGDEAPKSHDPYRVSIIRNLERKQGVLYYADHVLADNIRQPGKHYVAAAIRLRETHATKATCMKVHFPEDG